jgi:Ca2+-transporting ATPase
VHWQPAQAIFRTTDLRPADWALAVLVASAVLLLDEGRKLAMRMWHRAMDAPRPADADGASPRP